MTARYVGVYLLDAPYHIDREYAYYLPVALAQEVRVGSIVLVPFGQANRRSYALVTSFSEESDVEKVKPVLAVLPDRFSLGEEMLGLCFFLREHTLCPLGDAVRCLLPSAAFSSVTEYYRASGAPLFDPIHAELAALFEDGKRRSREELLAIGSQAATLSRLVEAGALVREYELKENKGKTEKYVSLANSAEEALFFLSAEAGKRRIRGEAQEKILRTLIAEGGMRRTDLCELTHTTTAQVTSLVSRGLLAEEEISVTRDPYAHLHRGTDRTPINLSRAQTAAYDMLLSLYEEREARAALLFGVTGSGKTKVMMKLIDRVIADGRQVIVMVPEIALTPQTVGIFCARYGDRVAVIHSSLGEGERFDAWRRIADGEIDLVIGTRSAVFAPLSNLGLIVMDEEHEHTYKSESDPKYHTRDVAAYRCGISKSLLILASATPSFESFHKAEQGKYTLVPLRERYGGASLPETEVVDMRAELRAGNRSPISARLLDALQETLSEGKQAILFLNRRGYNTTVSCKGCGSPVTCPNCSVALTYHTDRTGGSMFCHLCGYRTAPARVCPECGSGELSYVGFGTQKAEAELAACLPEARVLRMDADTTTGKASYDRLLDRFRKGEADILLGTQMVTKGHDFPNVALVGVLLADTSLYMNDFRSTERTFSQLTQVIGRAGRADTPGRAIIQTYAPQNEAIGMACRQDYDGFYRSEIELRRTLSFPPFCDIVQLTVSSAHEDELMTASHRLLAAMTSLARREYPDLPLALFGPFEAGVYKAAGKFRLRMVAKCRLGKKSREFFARVMTDFGTNVGRRVTLSLDENPL
ncbi:MAG: primosomal protein N' [Clostridia bacterium]|nr:primosomal protein N' [Clostridia bacterium]MBQ8858164.1 primosomal protein N' [Clostridia bacterium]